MQISIKKWVYILAILSYWNSWLLFETMNIEKYQKQPNIIFGQILKILVIVPQYTSDK